MDPAMIGLISQGVGSMLQMPLGLGQILAGSLMKPKRPEYQIPSDIRNMLALRQLNLRGRMAGATQAEKNIMQSQANAVGTYQRMQTNPNAILSGVSASQGLSNRAFTDLATQEAVDYQRRLSGLENAQRTMGNYQDKQWQLNEYEPYQDKARTKAALIGAGLKNFFGAAAGVSESFQDYAGYKMMQDYYGTGSADNTTPGIQSPLNGSVSNFNFAPKAGAVDLSQIPANKGMFYGNDPEPTQQLMMEMTKGPLGIDAMRQNMEFNQFAEQFFGKSATNLTPVQLNMAYQIYKTRNG